MSAHQREPEPSIEGALQLAGLAETAVMARSLEELAEGVLPSVAKLIDSPWVLLYLSDSGLAQRRFFPHGLPPEAVSGIVELCAEQFERASRQADTEPVSVCPSADWKLGGNALFYPLREGESCVGLVGVGPQGDVASSRWDLWARCLRVLAAAIDRLRDRAESKRQLAHLNAYLSVSSMLSQYLGLQESLEIALYCSMDVVSAEAASVLLLDDDKTSFRFYQVEGPAKPVLAGATFPADKGLAGSVLQSQQSEVINDVHEDPRFYGKIDSESGFQTRNMIVMPLTAGEERIGVLEILNKAQGGHFTEEERLLVLSIADEIAFAIRNAKVFEYVVNSYCKQRQGQTSCKGCKRPLGSWTPCVRYREALA